MHLKLSSLPKKRKRHKIIKSIYRDWLDKQKYKKLAVTSLAKYGLIYERLVSFCYLGVWVGWGIFFEGFFCVFLFNKEVLIVLAFLTTEENQKNHPACIFNTLDYSIRSLCDAFVTIMPSRPCNAEICKNIIVL